MRKVITFGTFDLLHEGHLRILQRARAEGDYLIVGVSSDQLNDRKGKRSVFPQAQRMAYIAGLKYVDKVFLEESLERKDDYVKQYGADLLVMGDDWSGKFDWVSCDVKYFPRTQGISSTEIKNKIREDGAITKALFGDTYLDKHMDCAISIINSLTERNVAPILTKENALPRKIKADALIYFNKPINAPFPEYEHNRRVLIDHGASHLKWFLGSRERFEFFDIVLTAGPDHVRALEAIFGRGAALNKVRATGFIKSEELLADPRMSRDEVAAHAGLDPALPIVLFAPTWHITANEDILRAIEEMKKVANHVASFHPETAHLPVNELNTVKNTNGITTELIKHADVVVSDLSSTIYEAAALGKPVVQLLLKEYPDNTAVLYDLPLSAGTAEHFCGGLTCRPADLVATIDRAASNDPAVVDMMAACRNRILAGTFIRQEATGAIADQIALACTEPRNTAATVSGHKDILPAYRRNLFFAQNRLIAHGGGNFEGHYASNSREAMEAGLKACDIVELDFCLGRDGVLVAHDSFEPRYGLTGAFEELETAAFEKSRFEGRLHPVSLAEAIRKCTRDGKALVCDIKPTKDIYKQVACAIRDAVDRYGQIEQTVIQCYSVEDFIEALRLGFQRVILPAWKYFYKNPIGSEVFNFYARCIEMNPDVVWGLSLPWVNKHMPSTIIEHPDFEKIQAFWKRIFIHGAPFEEYPRVLKMNVGLFADGLSRQFEFKDFPEGFDWRQYLFLNRDLLNRGHDTEIQAVLHYLRYGKGEGRKIGYNLPKDFTYAGYINKNSKLRKASINAINSAAAHYTNYGSKEGLLY